MRPRLPKCKEVVYRCQEKTSGDRAQSRGSLHGPGRGGHGDGIATARLGVLRSLFTRSPASFRPRPHRQSSAAPAATRSPSEAPCDAAAAAGGPCGPSGASGAAGGPWNSGHHLARRYATGQTIHIGRLGGPAKAERHFAGRSRSPTKPLDPLGPRADSGPDFATDEALRPRCGKNGRASWRRRRRNGEVAAQRLKLV